MKRHPPDSSEREPAPLWRADAHGRERHHPGVRWWHDNHQRAGPCCVAQLALGGSMDYVDGHGRQRLTPGDLLLFTQPGDSSYGLPADATATFVTEWVSLSGAGLIAHWHGLIAQRGAVMRIAIDGPEHRSLSRLGALSEPRARTTPLAMAAAAHAFVMQLWSTADSARTSAMRPVDQAIEAMLAAPTAPWSLKELAERHGVSREHLSRAFAERTGSPPAAWIVAQRVRRALELLERTDLPIRDVRDQSGFSSSHTLIRRVRDSTGCSPLAWRLRMRKAMGGR